MKKKSIIIVCVVYIVLYIVLALTCSDYISFENRMNVLDKTRVAKLYFITLPIAAFIPIIIYWLITKMFKKNNKEEPQQQSQDTQPQQTTTKAPTKSSFDWKAYMESQKAKVE